MQNSDEYIPMIGAIVFSKDSEVDSLMHQVALTLQNAGFNTAGFIQYCRTSNDRNCQKSTVVENLLTGQQLEILQQLGGGSRGCRLNPTVLAEATEMVLTQLDNRPDLLFLNRFGRGESEGTGFRIAIEKASELNIPVLLAVRDPYIDALEDFVGGYLTLLPMDPEEVMNWCTGALKSYSGLKQAV